VVSVFRTQVWELGARTTRFRNEPAPGRRIGSIALEMACNGSPAPGITQAPVSALVISLPKKLPEPERTMSHFYHPYIPPPEMIRDPQRQVVLNPKGAGQ
jgi:hypothetical protein